MPAVMQGIRILEVAEQTFVPAASALMADWGAEVIKIEHVQRGDAMRGLASTGTAMVPKNVHVLWEHSNRGKQSLGLDLTTPEGLDILYKLAATADIFLTNKLPKVRTKLSMDVEDIRAHNPNIIYVRGTGQGERGPDADKGSYDALAFWDRAGVAMGVMTPGSDHVPMPPGPGFGDSIGAMTITGGMAAALYHRERTGEGLTVDVSLLSAGMWAQGQAIGLSVLLEMGWAGQPPADAPRNPLVNNYRTSDGRWVALICLQALKYWGPLCACLGKPELATDERFATFEALTANSPAAVEILTEAFASRTVAQCREDLEDFIGQWTVIQDTLEAARDVQSVANGYMQDCVTAEGNAFQLVAAPVQFNEEPAAPKRAPSFNEHGDAILTALGLDMDAIIALKIKGVVA